uniref:Uncharacterized protein n=1 Tax=Vitis vinifera TaxID=29760 RepID=A5CA06_VITVI|nr:hypothetical protein VITISV_005427 [Vitis vinifera]
MVMDGSDVVGTTDGIVGVVGGETEVAFSSKWKGLALQYELPLMGSVVTIGRLIINSGDMSKGKSESVGGLEALDDSLGPEVLALLARGRRTELSRHEVVAHGVVGEEGPVASPPSKGGILRASAAKEGESLGT